jgi:hypothetical protein
VNAKYFQIGCRIFRDIEDFVQLRKICSVNPFPNVPPHSYIVLKKSANFRDTEKSKKRKKIDNKDEDDDRQKVRPSKNIDDVARSQYGPDETNGGNKNSDEEHRLIRARVLQMAIVFPRLSKFFDD